MDRSVKMHILVKSILFLYLLIEIIQADTVSFLEITLLLIFIAVTIYKEKFNRSSYVSSVTLLLAVGLALQAPAYAILFVYPCYDFMLRRVYAGAVIAFGAIIYFLMGQDQLWITLALALCSILLAYQLQKSAQDERKFTSILDTERSLRYELERAKQKLLQSSKEIATMTEIKERNRIARELHDSIGHSMAGILIQLQAAQKVYTVDQDQSMALLQKSITGLADSVQLLRDTVHNIKPSEKLGIENIQSIIDNFSFCPVKLKTVGDLNAIPPRHFEIITTNIKEALTNTARYSQATLIELQLEVSELYTRLYIKDNGVGCTSIKEGLGLSGMRERVRNVGGSISVSSNQGFLIVCVIPKEEGSAIFESINRG